MILRRHGGMELLVTIWLFSILMVNAQNKTEENRDELANKTISKVPNNSTAIPENVEEIVKSQRRAHRFDTAESSPWVRVYNRFPGSNPDNFFNYETRGNTSAHTSKEGWDAFKTEISDRIPADRRESKGKVTDLLRVKPKVKEAVVNAAPPKNKLQNKTQTKPPVRTPAPSTKAPLPTTSLSTPARNDSSNKGYIIWSSNDGGVSGRWTLDDLKDADKKTEIPNDIMPKDGSHWKVIGEGGDDGWQVVDDKGEVEWKIEYDDGEWRVTSTGEIPVDAEWVDPEYVWGSADGSLEDDEYNSWQADDYAYAPWADPVAYVRGIGNHSWPKNDDQSQSSKINTLKDIPTVGVKTAASVTKQPPVKETKFQFGARRKAPEKNTSSAQERTDNEKADTLDHTSNKTTDAPQADQSVPGAKSWYQVETPKAVGQKWVQGYGTKTWEADNAGWNSDFGGETWITANKDFPTSQWVPKSSIGQVLEVPKAVVPEPDNNGPKKIETPIRAWGTGYGSKTWQGNKWDSNVVWKTGVDSPLPWVSENNTNTWKFPDEISNSNEYDDQANKKPIVWSQPIPSDDSEPNSKAAIPPNKGISTVRIKWPTRTTVPGNNSPKTPPSRRTEEESWEDDSSEGGVVWKGQDFDITPPTDVSIGSLAPKLENNSIEKWQIDNWKINSQEGDPRLSIPWKVKSPPKSSNLLSVKWKSDENIGDNPPLAWNPNPWPVAEPGYPAWLFGGCKMTIKCGSTETDTADDSTDQNTPPDTSEDTPQMTTPTETPQTTLPKGWPKQFYGKSWKPPTKSWKPPTKSWKPPTKSWKPPASKPSPPPTIPDTPTPTEGTPMDWKNSPPSVKWPKPTPNSNMMWKKPPPNKSWNPPATAMWTETTPPVPSMSWPPSPSMKWKKPGPRPTKSWKSPPTKSWKPPRTKSWKPPTPPNQTWKPSIATPVPDVWTSQGKPDCKDTEGTTRPTPEPTAENDEEMSPPQIIIITKLPSNPKSGPPPSTDKPVMRGDTKRKTKGKSWVFPPKKGGSKTSKNRRDRIPMNMNRWPMKAKKMSKPGSKGKGWSKGMLPPNFAWPANTMRRWTTKKPSAMAGWKPPKYVKSKAWKQMFKKWMSGRMNM